MTVNQALRVTSVFFFTNTSEKTPEQAAVVILGKNKTEVRVRFRTGHMLEDLRDRSFCDEQLREIRRLAREKIERYRDEGAAHYEEMLELYLQLFGALYVVLGPEEAESNG